MRAARHRSTRSGKVLVLFALFVVALLGMVGLVIDGGLLMGAHRRSQNASDSGALAAALTLMRGGSTSQAKADATTFVQTRNGLTDATVTVNIPPSTGPYEGNVRYAEVTVVKPVSTFFIPIVGANRNQQVVTRAVAGYEAVSSGEGAIVLDPLARPGLAVTGGATLRVNGAVVVNSGMAGIDQYGAVVNYGPPYAQQYALATSNNSRVQCRHIQVFGGVDVVANYQPYETGDPSPLYCRAPFGPDPLRELPTPTSSTVTGITNWNRIPSVTVTSGENRTFTPGVYANIQINQGATVTFQPGIYIFSPTGPNQGLRAIGSCNITGNGVMFYLTGSNYLSGTPGSRDATDDAQAALDGMLPPTNAASIPPSTDTGKVDFATMDINATNANINLTGLADASSPYNGILFYQRRRNMNTAAIQGNAGVNTRLNGTIYAKWARFKLAGGGVYDSQFVVGSMDVSGQAVVTINANGRNFGRANQVYLVE